MRKLIFLFVLVCMVVGARATDVVFKANAPEAVVMGEQFRLTFTVNAEGRDIRVPTIPDFEVLMGPSQSTSYSSSWVNGQSKSETSVSFTYILMPKKEGTFTIPAATVKVNGANYTSNSLTIKVLPADKAGKEAASDAAASGQISNDRLFVTMDVSKRSLYEQEGLLVTFKIYSLENFQITNLKYPEFEGFLVQEIELPQQKQLTLENYKGRNYQSAVMRQVLLYPQRSGKITIGAGRYDALVRVRMQQRTGSLFDDFFDSYRDINKVLTTNPVTIDVKPLPSGKPASFSGGVGSFTMSTEISAKKVKANEAVTIKLKLSGNGNVKLLKNPEVKFPNDFDIYDPKVETDVKTTTAGVSGSKTIEYMAIPRYAGKFEIPAVEFSYFDIKSGAYKTLKSEAFELEVEPGEGGNAAAPVVSNFNNKESVKYLGKDVRYLKTKGFRFVTPDDIFYGSLANILWYVIPALLFIAFFVIYRKQVRENANIALVRTKRANKVATKRLKIAGKLMAENKREAFYEEILRALWGYLSDKLSIPQAELTKDNVEAELAKYGVSENLMSEFMDILNTCEFARYAPSAETDAMDKLYQLTVDAIEKMESTIKK